MYASEAIALQILCGRNMAKAGHRTAVVVSVAQWDYHQLGMAGGDAPDRVTVEMYDGGGMLLVCTEEGAAALAKRWPLVFDDLSAYSRCLLPSPDAPAPGEPRT